MMPISIHAPHTGRDAYVVNTDNAEVISIHAPHTGRDHYKDNRHW